MKKYDELKVFCKNTNEYLSIDGGDTLINLYETIKGRVGLKGDAVCVLVNNKVEDLHYPVFSPKHVEFIDIVSNGGFRVYTRSLCMVLYKALNDLYPGKRLCIQHSISNGHYCQIKHGSVRMQVGDKWIYVDPVTTAVKPVTDYSTLPQADYILVTHEHFDHLDSVAINQLSKEGTELITNARCHEILGGKGKVMANGDFLELPNGWTVDAVPAYNNSPEKLQFHPKGRDNGFVLTIEGMRIYIAGDTEDIPEMADIKDIDVAFLPCNLPYTMTPEQCARAATMIKPTVLFPYHYGQTDIQLVVKLLEGSGIDVRIRDYQ